MQVFTATLEQTAFLFLFILLGYILVKGKLLPDDTQMVLSKLENYVFIPALVLTTFLDYFTPEKISVTWKLLLFSLALELIVLPMTALLVKLCSKDAYERNIYRYGLCFSNFGFMGNAVVSVMFPEVFLEYLIFTLPLWSIIYLWGVPVMLMGESSQKPKLRQRMRNFVNPMLICTVLGMMLGALSVPVPQFIRSAVGSASNCMSPVAMMLTGMTIARFNLKDVLRIKGVYIVTALRLVLLPALFLIVLRFVTMPQVFAVCAVCSLAMPLGLNTIIIPNALGKDTRVAAGMALVSHVVACITIPMVFAVLNGLLP